LKTYQIIFRSRKLTSGQFVKLVLTTKLDSVRQYIYSLYIYILLIGVTGDCKRKLVACKESKAFPSQAMGHMGF
jgi:hypothetical protein